MQIPENLAKATQQELDDMLRDLSAERDRIRADQARVKAEHDRRAAWDRQAHALALLTPEEQASWCEANAIPPAMRDRLLMRAEEIRAYLGQTIEVPEGEDAHSIASPG